MKLTNLFCKKSSSDVAKDRLKILLISDRINCSPEMMEMIKADIAKVLSKYMKINAKGMEIKISKAPSIFANIPIIDLNKQMQTRD